MEYTGAKEFMILVDHDKVGRNMATVIDIGTLIVQTPGTCGGRPRIAGTRVAVRNIVTLIKMGSTPEKIVEESNRLSLAQVHAALAYYYANQEELDAAFAQEEAEEDRLEQEYLASRATAK